MDKTQSFFIVRDSTELKYAQLIWDICEVATRISRRNLAAYEAEAYSGLNKKANGIISIQYMTCLNDGKQFGKEVTQALLKDVITTHNEEAYQEYRTQIDSLLQELEEFATTEEEINRIQSGIPDKGYKFAPTLIGDLMNRGEIQY